LHVGDNDINQLSKASDVYYHRENVPLHKCIDGMKTVIICRL